MFAREDAWFGRGRAIVSRLELGLVSSLKVALFAFYEL